jgi:glycosyltransferase involved in cell wall biosynthesis
MVDAQAGTYSVPSKVLSYMCTGKPLLLSVPDENLAARIVRRERAGLVATPQRRDDFLANASRLMASAELCATLGQNGLSYAERAFDINRIADRFERIVGGVSGAVLPTNAPATLASKAATARDLVRLKPVREWVR